MRYALALSAAVLACLVLAAGPARAFDTQPHFDMTRAALAAEGFGGTAIEVVQINNWFNDLYENPTKNPYSGHATGMAKLIALIYGDQENWPPGILTASARAHFDSDSDVTDTAGEDREWTRLARATRAALLNRAGAGDIEGILSVLGITLHMVQDFYTHSNWVEPFVDATYAAGGPGWAGMGRYGSHPTWFDVPAEARNAHRIYSAGPRDHGVWNTDNNESLRNGLNKDWAGRPLHYEAYITAYIASRQWVRAARTWLGNDALWTRVQQFSDRHGNDLSHDQQGAYAISRYAGHWNGNGEPALASNPGPGGSLDDLGFAIRAYFEEPDDSDQPTTKTFFRRKWEEVIPLVDARTPPEAPTPVPSSLSFSTGTEFVVVEITQIREIDDRDVGALDQADWYSTANIAGDEYRSGIIFGRDEFNFLTKPYGPFSYVKPMPAGTEPVPIMLRLFDEDGGLYGDDDHCDISPAAGIKNLRITYDRRTGGITGAITANGGATVRGAGDGNRAEIAFRVRTLRVAGTTPQRATVTFESVRLVDTTRPGQQGKLFFTFEVNGRTIRHPASGTLDATLGSPIALPAGTRISAEPRVDQNEPLVISVRATDESRMVTLRPPAPPEPTLPGRMLAVPRRIPPDGGGTGGGTQVPLSVIATQSYTPGQDYGSSQQAYTVRSPTFEGAYLEVVYRVQVQTPRPRPDGRLEVPPTDVSPGRPQPRPPVRPGVGVPR